MLLELGQRNEHVGFAIGLVEVVAGVHEAAAGNHETRVGFVTAEEVGVFKLNQFGGGSEVLRTPAGFDHEILERLAAVGRALKQANAARAGIAKQRDERADDLGVDPLRLVEVNVAHLIVGGAGHVELDGDGLAVDQLVDAAERDKTCRRGRP